MLEWNLNCKGIVKEYNSCKNELDDIYIYIYIYIYDNIVEWIIVGSKIQCHYECENLFLDLEKINKVQLKNLNPKNEKSMTQLK